MDENKNSHQKITQKHAQTTCPNCIALHAGKKGVRPAEVGALVSASEKSATEVKLKQKLLKSKCTIQIVTFNVTSLNRISQLLELTASAIDHNIDIICIEEHRYTHSEDIKYHDTGNGQMLATASAGKNSVTAMIGGVGMLVRPWALKSQNSIEKMQLRMIVATFNGNLSTTIISSCYSPNNVNEETDLIAFYNELSSLVHSILKHYVLIIGGDMNAQIGKNINHKFSLHNSSNRNGEHLQGDTLVPYLFIICLDYVLRTSIDKWKTTVSSWQSRRYPTHTDTDYTDDIALLANTPAQAESLLHSLEWAATGIGHYVNADKTEYTKW